MKNGLEHNFVACKPKKEWVRIEIRLSENADLTKELEEAGVEVEYHANWGKYLIRISPGETFKNTEILKKLFQEAYNENES